MIVVANGFGSSGFCFRFVLSMACLTNLLSEVMVIVIVNVSSNSIFWDKVSVRVSVETAFSAKPSLPTSMIAGGGVMARFFFLQVY